MVTRMKNIKKDTDIRERVNKDTKDDFGHIVGG